MKKRYESAYLEIIRLNAVDLLSASGEVIPEWNDPDELPDDTTR
jgi:hypothetical protein